MKVETSRHLLLHPDTTKALAAELQATVAACRARNYNVEGIPMFLVLEDLTEAGNVPTSGPGLHNALLAATAELALGSLETGAGEVGHREIALACEVTAHLFTLGAAEDAR